MKILAFAFGVDKNHGAFHAITAEKPKQQGKFFFAADMEQHLFDIVRGHTVAGDAHLFRHIHELVGQFHDPLAECGGKHQILPLVKRRQTSQDESQVGDKTHVEHAVGLIDHQHFNRFEAVDLLLEVVDQASRGADDDIRAVAQGIALLHVIHAAIDGLDCKTAMLAQKLGIIFNLDNEFPGWRQDQCAGILAGSVRCFSANGQKG